MEKEKRKAISHELKLIAKELYATTDSNEMTDEKAREIEKGIATLKKEIDFKGVDGIAQVSFAIYTHFFSKPMKLTARGQVTGKVIMAAEDLKKYADAFAKANQAYQNGKKKVESFAKKYGFELVWE